MVESPNNLTYVNVNFKSGKYSHFIFNYFSCECLYSIYFYLIIILFLFSSLNQNKNIVEDSLLTVYIHPY